MSKKAPSKQVVPLAQGNIQKSEKSDIVFHSLTQNRLKHRYLCIDI